MRALLVYPEYPETFWNFKYALKFIARKATYPPLGLLTVAALLPDDWELRLVDMNVAALGDDDLRWADVVLLSAMSVQQLSVRAVLDRCRALGVTTIAGGPLFTTNPEAYADVDHLVLNEAEITLPDFLRDFSQGQARHCYSSPQRADLAATPIPRWELLDFKHYAAMNLQLTRGCPFDCEFCNITSLFGRVPRMKAASQIIAELERLYALGWREGVFFVDDNFIGPKKAVKEEVLPAMIDWMNRRNYPFALNTQVSINLADDPELLRLMTHAGFTTVFIGIESPNAASLHECNKTPNKHRDLLACVHAIHRAGLQVQAGFIVGFDNDPASIFDQLIAFIQESGIVTAMVGLLNALHGTRLYQRLQAEGRLVGSSSGDNTDYTLNFTPAMNLEALQQGYQRIIDSIYAPNVYYQRVKLFLREYRPVRGHSLGIKFGHLATIWKTTLALGFVEKERTYFWRLLFWSLFHRPRLLPLAMTLTAFGYHFRKCFEHRLPAEG